ncbi:MAG TPA: glutamate decarboxylase [Crenotrichaceae bacterium]|nr:glutamate decarboxylase [Crenotrichaceae bacterium]
MKFTQTLKSLFRPAKQEESPYLTPVYGGRWDTQPIEKNRLPEDSLLPTVAFRIVADEMNLEGNPALNLATFVTTWMEPEADELIKIGATKNLIDEDEYPQLKVIEDRIIRMQANLFNVPEDCEPTGVTTIGSSEAIMLALLAHKWTWRKKRQEAGLDDAHPNIIFGADVHTCWEKFARYFDVEMKVIPLQNNKYTINADDVAPLLDDNTIAVGVIAGTTFTGQIDDIQSINDLLLQHKSTTGMDIPIHVDAASGGFVLPFYQSDFIWDFRLEQVRSINVSNHKFGLVYAGMGSVIFKDTSDLPHELPFEINYLGGSMQNYSLNFSKGSSNLLAQYYMFLRLGQSGYRKIINSVMSNAQYMEQQLVKSGFFEILTDAEFLPTVVVRLIDDSHYSVYQISDELRKFGWIVPAYSLPPNAHNVDVLRMVVKENFSRDLADKLLSDIITVINQLKNNTPGTRSVEPAERTTCKTTPHGPC